MWIFSCWDKSWPFQLQKLRFWIKSAFSGEFLVVEEEKTYCSDQEALCMEALHWNKRFEKQNASKIYFKRLPIAQLIDAVYKRSQRWYIYVRLISSKHLNAQKKLLISPGKTAPLCFLIYESGWERADLQMRIDLLPLSLTFLKSKSSSSNVYSWQHSDDKHNVSHWYWVHNIMK